MPRSPERGLRGEYFRTQDLSGTPALVRTDAQIGFRWDRGSPTDNLQARGEAGPGQGVPNDRFSIRWSGQLLPPVSGRYRIEASADDGFRLYVDGKRVLDHWTDSDRLRALRQRAERLHRRIDVLFAELLDFIEILDHRSILFPASGASAIAYRPVTLTAHAGQHMLRCTI